MANHHRKANTSGRKACWYRTARKALRHCNNTPANNHCCQAYSQAIDRIADKPPSPETTDYHSASEKTPSVERA
jgi:hypothetical protein